ncbi:uncharacterized protein LOC107611258 [Arachis ipaensis]|uniref:uncharacterized protein LOC107611258 n=1 Tax=Arachis ipaensis TaxID=130454 RepID=UPI0007AF00F6|nr:uncharacterized protein LOC107611258 [Arachis ipaensis]XP_025670346.1 uncharacterized protein LOC112770150 [Arachis hypogaea]
MDTIAAPPVEIYNALSDMSESLILSGKETLKEGGTVIFTKEAEPQEPATEGLKEIKDQYDPENAIEHAPTEEKEPQVDSSLGVQEELVITREHALAEVKELQELPFLGVQTEPEDEQLAHFLAALKKLQVNISVAEVLEKKTPYTTCLKGILFEKKDLRGDETVVLTKEYSAFVQNELPRKTLDIGSFQLLSPIGKITFDKALYDLGLSLNLIPSYVMKKLGIQEVQETMITLQRTNQFLRQSHGLAENVLVKVGELFFPAVSDMEEDAMDSIIPGKSFLATKKALIDVER